MERADNEHVLKACDGLLPLVVSPTGWYVLWLAYQCMHFPERHDPELMLPDHTNNRTRRTRTRCLFLTLK